jgi:hypothetical protein
MGDVPRLRLAFGFSCAKSFAVSPAVERILEQVKHLSSEEQKELWDSVVAEEAKNLDEWEKQVERDSNTGKLDHLLSELKDDIKAGRVKPLDEVINEP